MHYLLSEEDFDIEVEDENGTTPLQWACIQGSYDSVRYLLGMGAKVGTANKSEGLTPLHSAIQFLDETREIKIIHKLLIYGADLNCEVRNLKCNFNRTTTVICLKPMQRSSRMKSCRNNVQRYSQISNRNELDYSSAAKEQKLKRKVLKGFAKTIFTQLYLLC